MTIEAAADGSALGNPGPSGWAWYVDENCWDAGGWAHGTNNKGELTAVLELLRATASAGEDLRIYCDSQYVINSVTKWMAGWKRKGWKKGDGKPPENLDIMKALDAAMEGRRDKVRFEWVKGHAGHPLNEAADALANGAAQSWQRGKAPEPGPGFVVSDTPGTPSRTNSAPNSTDSVEPSVHPVVELERKLLSDGTARNKAEKDRLLHADWAAISVSGRQVSRAQALDGPGASSSMVDVLSLTEPGPGLALLVWRSTGHPVALRSSLWTMTPNGWQQLFHQATRAQP